MDDFKQKIEQIKKDKIPQTITPRELLNGLNCYKRTSGNCAYIDKFLEENQLEVSPNYTDVWIDSTIKIRHKEIAETKIPKDPVKRVQILERKSTRLNSSHANISYAVFCLKKK